MDTIVEKKDNVPFGSVLVQMDKPLVTSNPEEAFTEKEWEETPHLPKGLNVDLTDSKTEDDPEVIDDSGELGVVELSLWKKFQASGMTSPTFGMKSLGGDFANFYALIKYGDSQKSFIVTAKTEGNIYESIILDYAACHDIYVTKDHMNLLNNNEAALTVISKTRRFLNLVFDFNVGRDTDKKFWCALWELRAKLPKRCDKKELTLPIVLSSILCYISSSKSSYHYQEAGCLILKRFDLENIALELEVLPIEITRVLNNAGLLLRSKLDGSYQIKKRINGVLTNTYVIKI